MAVVGEYGQEVRRGEEAGRQVVVGLVHELGQPVGDRLLEVVGDETESYGPDEVGLGVGGDPTGVVDELGPPGRQHGGGQVAVAAGLGLASEQRRGTAEQRGRAVQERGGDIAHVLFEGEDFGRVAAGLTPLAPVEAGVPEEVLVRGRVRAALGP